MVWRAEYTFCGDKLFPEARLYGNTLPSFGTTAGEHSSSAFGLHASAKTVRLGTTATVRLKRTLRHRLMGLLLKVVCVGQTRSIKELGPFVPAGAKTELKKQAHRRTRAKERRNVALSMWRRVRNDSCRLLLKHLPESFVIGDANARSKFVHHSCGSYELST